MSRSSKARSKAPIKAAATVAATAESAATEIVGAAANPPGSGVPGGTNTPASSGAAAGSASVEQVKPHGKDGTSTPGTVTDATNSQPAPGAEAVASGDIASSNEPSQGAVDAGAANAAGSSRVGGGFIASAQDAVEFALRQIDAQELGIPTAWALSEDMMRKHYPLTCRLIEGCDRSEEPTLRISAKTDGFRRAGLSHSRVPVDFAILSLSPDQLEAMLGEPELTVEIV